MSDRGMTFRYAKQHCFLLGKQILLKVAKENECHLN